MIWFVQLGSFSLRSLLFRVDCAAAAYNGAAAAYLCAAAAYLSPIESKANLAQFL